MVEETINETAEDEEITIEETDNEETVSAEEGKNTDTRETSAEIPAESTEEQKPSEDLYIYDADDEPVEDRDLYSDYSGTAQINVRKTTAEPAGPEPVRNGPRGSSGMPAQAASQKPVKLTPEPDVYSPPYNAPEKESADYNENMPKQHEKEHKTSGRPSILFVNTVISMITLCVVAGGIATMFAYTKLHEQQLRTDQSRMDHLEQKVAELSAKETEDGEYIDVVHFIDDEKDNEVPVALEESMDVDRGKIITYDSYVGYSWVPVLSGVKTNSYDKSGFTVDDENRLSYKVNGEVSSYFGIDVSAHQGDIDWNAVRADGVEFAILRIGVRGYGEEGNIRLDDKFFQNYEGARDAGIDIGVYFYSQAISVDEAIEEANFVLEQLGGRKLEYPVAFDWEPVDSTVDGSIPRTDDVMPGTFNLSARAFCETIEDAGYKAMIYANKKMAYLKYDLRLFEGYPMWLALYTTDMTYYYDFDIWQYGAGKVAGIDGDVDVNIAMIR